MPLVAIYDRLFTTQRVRCAEAPGGLWQSGIHPGQCLAAGQQMIVHHAFSSFQHRSQRVPP